MPLVNTRERDTIAEYIELIDGLVVSGGRDIDPKYFGQKPHKSIALSAPERDNFELEMIKAALEKNIPVLGICRGLQVINVALGGTLYQDLECMPTKTMRHANPREILKVFHAVDIEPGTQLHRITGSSRIEVNSSHHQVVDALGRGLVISARSSDGVIEAFEDPNFKFFISVQWHPEMIPKRDHSRKLFDALIRACG